MFCRGSSNRTQEASIQSERVDLSKIPRGTYHRFRQAFLDGARSLPSHGLHDLNTDLTIVSDRGPQFVFTMIEISEMRICFAYKFTRIRTVTYREFGRFCLCCTTDSRQHQQLTTSSQSRTELHHSSRALWVRWKRNAELTASI
ncbi:hypothetical protein PROFUN_08775 [Planoprotostelium fungivorum]|uniref:Uncharacterized protein n=1 Tax=Planoprotostelium fungivorum TaxID=1890364 RepID=A0A2P6MVN8_9EUKA|nr:hypothetical protein PROFUN_08775 [Planoprotostelium fungivorum]